MSIWETAIGIIAPPECVGCGAEDSALCADCSSKLITEFGERCFRCSSLSPNCRTCASCRHTGAPAHVYVVTDYDDAARDLLRLYKFGHQRAAAAPIAKTMASIFLKYRGERHQHHLVVPVPTATVRIRQRGFGHSELLAKKIARELKMDRACTLRRYGQVRQLGARREDRLRQLKGSFEVKQPRLVQGRYVLLIDDVVTTGGTLIATAETLRAAGARQVDALLFAKRL
jgi:ComF family protein